MHGKYCAKYACALCKIWVGGVGWGGGGGERPEVLHEGDVAVDVVVEVTAVTGDGDEDLVDLREREEYQPTL